MVLSYNEFRGKHLNNFSIMPSKRQEGAKPCHSPKEAFKLTLSGTEWVKRACLTMYIIQT